MAGAGIQGRLFEGRITIHFRRGFHACDDWGGWGSTGRPTYGCSDTELSGVVLRQHSAKRVFVRSKTAGRASALAPSVVIVLSQPAEVVLGKRIASPLGEYPAWCVVTGQISDPLMMRSGSLNSVAPLGPAAGIWNPLAKAPTLFFGTDIGLDTAKVGYSFLT